MHTDEEIAEAAYYSYGEAVGWKNYLGKPMPSWSDLPSQIQQAWQASCKTAIRLHQENE